MKLNKSVILFGCGLLTLGITSCKEDVVFDQNNYNNYLRESFPVKNVDPDHTWATLGSAEMEITIDLDYGVTYDVGVYLENPIGSAQATRVYEKKAKSGETVNAVFSYKLAQPVVYVGVYDQKGRGMAQAITITDGRGKADISTNISSSARQRASEDASVYSQFVKTYGDYLNPQTDLYGNTLNTKQVTVAEMQAYPTFTDADLASNATLTNGSWKWSAERGSYQEYIGGGDGKHFRVAAGTTITTKFEANGTYGVYNDVVIYIEGTVHLNGNTLNGPTLVVANGGEIVVDGNTSMSNAGRIVVLKGGKISGSKGVTYNVNNGAPCYNAGTIEFTGELNVNGSDFYNAADGSVKVDVLRNTSGGKFTNFGKIEARTNTQAGDTYNSTVINGCHMKFTENAGIGTLTMLDNSRLDVGGTAEFGQATQTLYKNSVINVGALYVTNTVFSGPTATGEFAIVKTGKVYIGRSGDITAQNNTWFDWDKSEIYHKTNGKYTDYETNIYSEGYWATHYQVTKYIDENTVLANFTIPAGDCTGAGYNSGGNNGGGKPQPTSLSMRFMFEDNFPDAGDYDFNDCVFKVTPVLDENNSKKVTVTVTAEASGAQKTIGAAIRLKGITDAMLASKSCTQAFPVPSANLGTYDNIPDGAFTTSRDPNDQSSVVMLLFKDIHWALNAAEGSNGGVQRYYYNTQQEGHTNYGKADVKTAVYVFEFSNEDNAKKMLMESTYDAFIVEPYNGSYWEVHTVTNDNKGALVLHPEVHISNYEAYLNAYVRRTGDNPTGHLPWAVVVPGTVAYPYEWIKITEAYPNFTGWAENRNDTKYQNWYESPVSGKTFPLP